MAKRYSIAQARSNLPSIVSEAAAGAEIALTRRGKPVAVVVSIQEIERLRSDRPCFRDAYEAFLEKHPLKQIGLDDDFFTSLRQRDSGRKVSL